MNMIIEPTFWWTVGFMCLSFSLLLFFFPLTEEKINDSRTTARPVARRVDYGYYSDDMPMGAGAPEWLALLTALLVLLAVMYSYVGGTNGPVNRNVDYLYYK